MNYRHLFHAGNFADVHKHVLLTGLLSLMSRKESPLCYMDSHAGCGAYDLGCSAAQKTLEFRDGISRVPAADQLTHEWMKQYRSLVDTLRRSVGNPQFYPGSPAVAASLLRPQDRGVLMELNPDDAETLRQWAWHQPQLTVHERNAYEGIPALIPPKEKRGLILIDPPYEEERDDFAPLVALIEKAVKKWPTGVYAVWYPIKEQNQIKRFYRKLEATGIRKQLICELCVFPPDTSLSLNGSGLLVINPPWPFADEATTCQQELWSLLSREGRGHHKVKWLVGE